jgi:hypothetical protein
MIPETLLAELESLSHTDKLRVVQFLVNHLAQEESALPPLEYEIWSPYESADAAAVLQQMLAEDRAQHE